ncbi:NAD(P)H-binding protein [Enterobacter hormaechei]
MIAITGATGQLGQHVIEELLKTVPASQIVAIVRNLAKAEALRQQGVVVRQADYTDEAAFTTALNGVDKLLLISSSEVGQRAVQHQNVINAAKAAGVKFIAYTSLLHADKSPLGLHVEHVETENALAGDNAWTLSELAAELSKQSGKPVTYQNLSEADFAAALKGVGLPAGLAEMLADSDTGASKGGLFDDSHTLSKLIGRPTTPLAESVKAIL